MTNDNSQIVRISTSPVWDERLNNWRLLIVRSTDGEMTARLEVGTFRSKSTADLHGQLILQALGAKMESVGLQPTMKDPSDTVTLEDVG